jgi:2-keto-4-pentenoate hydratase/2-oxohepta-3-ene-1,7-dioic acid hydratase in catechol pathway
MKLLRYGPTGAEKPAIVDSSGTIRDISSIVPDITGETLTATIDVVGNTDPATLPAVSEPGRIGPCVANPSKIVCLGLNYRDHAAETGKPIPTEPILFMKAPSSLAGPNDDILLPDEADKGDWEAELGIVIGRKAQYVPESDWLDHVAGFCVVNDVSERGFQTERGGQWVKGKSADTFCPTGPWLVTPDEAGDPQHLALGLSLNGEPMQQGNTEDMIFGCAHALSYISRFMTLLPGDIIATGTPAGVGLGRNRFLRDGDRLRVSVEGLGEQEQRVRSFENWAPEIGISRRRVVAGAR